MKKLEPYENQMGYLVGGSRLPSTPGEMELEHKCNPYPNDRIVKVGDTFMPYALARLVMIQKQGGHHVVTALSVINTLIPQHYSLTLFISA